VLAGRQRTKRFKPDDGSKGRVEWLGQIAEHVDTVARGTGAAVIDSETCFLVCGWLMAFPVDCGLLFETADRLSCVA
jgi:hypothetical protein